MSDADPTFVPSLTYRDPRAAIAWLERAFGFEITMAIDAPDGSPTSGHYELAYEGQGRITVGGEWADWVRSPGAGGANTQTVHVALTSDLDAHCAAARAAGALILAEPEDQFYGARTYRAQDPEGHVWTFSLRVREVSRAEAEAATGLRIEAKDWA